MHDGLRFSCFKGDTPLCILPCVSCLVHLALRILPLAPSPLVRTERWCTDVEYKLLEAVVWYIELTFGTINSTLHLRLWTKRKRQLLLVPTPLQCFPVFTRAARLHSKLSPDSCTLADRSEPIVVCSNRRQPRIGAQTQLLALQGLRPRFHLRKGEGHARVIMPEDLHLFSQCTRRGAIHSVPCASAETHSQARLP
jgi:hypothetical protein